MSRPLDRLPELVDALVTRSTAQGELVVGPVPLEMRATDSRHVDALAPALASSAGPRWPALQVVIATEPDAPHDLLPPALRTDHDELRRAVDGTVTALSDGKERVLWLLDTRGTAVLWTSDFDRLPLWEHTSPLRTPLRWWALRNGAAMLHAGAVADEHGAVLLVGDSGAGKSTSTMACHGGELRVLGDDFCLVESPSDGRPAIAHPMYSLAKLDDRALELLPAFADRIVGTAWRGKKLIDLGSRHQEPAPVLGLCHVVRDRGAGTRIEPMSRIQALRAVAPSTMFQQRLGERETWDVLASIARSVPTHRLVVDAPSDVPAVIGGLLATPRESRTRTAAT